MGITLTIELEQLAEPAVSDAFSKLILALGGMQPAAVKPARAVSLAPAARAPVAQSVAPAPRPAHVSVAPAPRPAPAPVVDDRSPEDRYADFVAALPERSRTFLDLVRTRGIVTIDVAMAELGVTVPKGMGGITGSIARWAPVRGVAIPYEATKVQGRRAWRWTGDGAQSTAPAPAAVELLEAPSEVLPGNAQERYDAFVGGLPDRTQRFLALVKAQGTLSRGAAIEALGLTSGKQLGGVTGAIGKWAPRRGVAVPYETITENGERAWKWLGVPDGDEQSAEVAEVVDVVVPAPAPAPAAVEAEAPESVVDSATLVDGLPEDSKQFVLLLEAQGSLSMPVLTKHFQLPRAMSVGRIIEPVKRRAKELGMALPFTKERAPEGYSVYMWTGSDAAIEAAKPSAIPPQMTVGKVAEEEASPVVSSSPGLRVRRRSSN
jgi:hypothetical protein